MTDLAVEQDRIKDRFMSGEIGPISAECELWRLYGYRSDESLATTQQWRAEKRKKK